MSKWKNSPISPQFYLDRMHLIMDIEINDVDVENAGLRYFILL